MNERDKHRIHEPLKPPGQTSKIQYVVFALLLLLTAYLVLMALQKP